MHLYFMKIRIKQDFLLIVLFFAFGIINASAQEKKIKADKAEKKSAALPSKIESVINDSVTETRYFIFPEFYHFWPVEINDTILTYECYDANNSLIVVDTLRDIQVVNQIRFVKSFVNYTHTFIDAEGKPKPSTIKRTIYQYSRAGEDKWKGIDMSSNLVSEFKESTGDIVRMDTTLIKNSVTGDNQMTIRKYYKVEELKIPQLGDPVK